MKNVLTFDVESSGATNDTYGNPFTPSNRLCCISYEYAPVDGEHQSDVLKIEYDKTPYGDNLRRFQQLVTSADLLVGFNIKFDLHWAKRYGIDFRGKPIWDTQYAYFAMNHQLTPDPALWEVAKVMRAGEKLDIIKRDYWEKGIDTPDVPWDLLYEYSLNDSEITAKIYEQQQIELKTNSKLWNNIWMHCQDISVTQEMEWNGLKYNMEKSLQKGRDVGLEIDSLTKELATFSTIELDWNSNDHLSALLYGGIVKKSERVSHPFTYKDGRQVMKERWEKVEYHLDRQIEPLHNTEVKKGGYYEVNETVLRKLSPKGNQRRLLNLIIKRKELMKLKGTYYEGIPELYQKFGWENEVIHGNINHVRAKTVRLASSNPNQQNLDERVLECIETRF